MDNDAAKAWIVHAYQHVRNRGAAATDDAAPPSGTFPSFPAAYPAATFASAYAPPTTPFAAPSNPAPPAGIGPMPLANDANALPTAHTGYAYPVPGDPALMAYRPVVTLTRAVCYPPPPHVAVNPPQEKPPGCKTIFIGGLPDKCSEEMLEELFARVGDIHSIRMSKKNFAHVRFVLMESVDLALAFSGYRMKVDDKSEKDFSGKLYIDYAVARDDQFEYNTQRRAAGLEPLKEIGEKDLEDGDLRKILEKEAEAKERRKRSRSRSRDRSDRPSRRGDRDRPRSSRRSPQPRTRSRSPRKPSVALRSQSPQTRTNARQFTDDEGCRVLEKLKDPKQFVTAVEVLVDWLERGECNKRTVYSFYNLVAAMNGQVRRLRSEKAVFDEALDEAKAAYQANLHGIGTQLAQVQLVFTAAQKQRNWDVFTKPQRRNLLQLFDSAKEASRSQLEQLIGTREEKDMMVDSDSDADDAAPATSRFDPSPFYQAQINALKSELDDARATIAEVGKPPETRTAFEKRLAVEREKTRDALAQLSQMQHTHSVWEETTKTQDALISKLKSRESPESAAPETGKLAAFQSAREARIIALTSSFLVVHPKGASLDYVVSYLQTFLPKLRNAETADVLARHAPLFAFPPPPSFMDDENGDLQGKGRWASGP